MPDEKEIAEAVQRGANLQRALDTAAHEAVLTRERSIIVAAAKLRNALYETLPPPYPNWGMGGGSHMEYEAQTRWEAKHAAGPDFVRVARKDVDRLYRMLGELPEKVTALGVELARAAQAEKNKP